MCANTFPYPHISAKHRSEMKWEKGKKKQDQWLIVLSEVPEYKKFPDFGLTLRISIFEANRVALEFMG